MRFLCLRRQLLYEASEDGIEWLAICSHWQWGDKATRSQHEAVLGDLVRSTNIAESRLSIFETRLQASPAVVRLSDPGYVLVGELAVDTADHRSHLTGVDEKHLAATVAERLPAFVGPLDRSLAMNHRQAGIAVP